MKKMTKRENIAKFRNEKMDDNKLNYLHGGDGDGSQTAPPDPWKP